MKKYIQSILLAICCLQTTFIFGADELNHPTVGQEGNGGAGVKRFGNIMTFGRAKISIKLTPMEPGSIPGLAAVKTAIESLPIAAMYKSKFLQAVTPALDRKYFRISLEDLNPEKKKALSETYKELLKAEVKDDELILFGVTDPKANETFLLPQFFELGNTSDGEISQAAVLFHEGVWIVRPDITYKRICDSEIAFENFARNPAHPFSSDLMENITWMFNNPWISIIASAQNDLQNHALDGFLGKDGKVSVRTFLGAEALQSVVLRYRGAKFEPYKSIYSFEAGSEVHELFSKNLLSLMDKYPNSTWLKEIYRYRSQLVLNRVWGPEGSQEVAENVLGVQRVAVPLPTQTTSQNWTWKYNLGDAIFRNFLNLQLK